MFSFDILILKVLKVLKIFKKRWSDSVDNFLQKTKKHALDVANTFKSEIKNAQSALTANICVLLGKSHDKQKEA